MHIIFPRRACLGLAIQADGIQLVELNQIRGRFHVLNHATIRYPMPAQESSWSLELKRAAAGIQAILKEKRIKTTRTVTAIPYTMITTDTLTLPQGLNIREIHQEIDLHLKQHYRAMQHGLIYDYASHIHPEEQTEQINLVLAKQQDILALLACLEACHLTPFIIDIDMLALVRAASYFMQKSGQKRDGMIVALQNKLRLLRFFKDAWPQMEDIAWPSDPIHVQAALSRLFTIHNVESLALSWYGNRGDLLACTKYLEKNDAIKVHHDDFLEPYCIDLSHPFNNSNNMHQSEYLEALGLALRGYQS